MVKTPTSFISEHSAEYVLVPSLVDIFAAKNRNIVPLYFWKTREGASISRSCKINVPLRVLSMYARRPKVIEPGENKITMKINSTLFQRSYYLNENGIPTIAGVPRVSTIENLQIGCPCSWFYLDTDTPTQNDIEISISVDSNQCSKPLPDFISGPLVEYDILTLLQEKSRLMSWQDAIEVICGDNYQYPIYSVWYTVYKPVYFLVMDYNN